MAGNRGNEFAADATVTMRNGVKGILGVAVIQSLAAGLWAFESGYPNFPPFSRKVHT